MILSLVSCSTKYYHILTARTLEKILPEAALFAERSAPKTHSWVLEQIQTTYHKSHVSPQTQMLPSLAEVCLSAQCHHLYYSPGSS